jgi:hypothetical protein
LRSLKPAVATTGGPLPSLSGGYYIYTFKASGSITF